MPKANRQLDPSTIPFNQGEAAFLTGQDPSANPYTWQSSYWLAWEQGFAHAVEEALS